MRQKEKYDTERDKNRNARRTLFLGSEATLHREKQRLKNNRQKKEYDTERQNQKDRI